MSLGYAAPYLDPTPQDVDQYRETTDVSSTPQEAQLNKGRENAPMSGDGVSMYNRIRRASIALASQSETTVPSTTPNESKSTTN